MDRNDEAGAGCGPLLKLKWIATMKPAPSGPLPRAETNEKKSQFH
jgi:hypothetical protein